MAPENVIFVSKNFILTSCIASSYLFSIINPFRQTKLANFIQSTSSNNRRSAYFKFRLREGALNGRRALNKKLLTCTDSAVVEG